MKPPSSAAPSPADRIALWPHQQQAVEMAGQYVAAFRAQRTAGSALVHLPTGTGKSGVIAMLARTLRGVGGVLVLTPRVALRDQLANDVEGRFFERLFPPYRAPLPKTVVCLEGKPTDAEKSAPDAKVYVSTIQLFHEWSRNQPDLQRFFARHIQLVLVDEGHYEPAASWQQAIRALRCPKVLFTATPYRNDLKVFDIDFEHVFSLTHAQALRERYLRSLVVHRRDRHHDDPAAFVEDVLRFYHQTFPDAGQLPADQQPRVILRCDAYDRIRQIAKALLDRQQSVVAIHEQFKDGDPARPHEHRRVPDPAGNAAIFWVHQFKLLEGLDDERFQVVAAFDELTNARSLVQQVGRTLRNRHQARGQQAHLLDHCQGRMESLWQGYLQYDEYLGEAGAKAVLQPGRELFEAWLKASPRVIYLDGSFRQSLNLSPSAPAVRLQLPYSANLHHREAGFDLRGVERQIGAICKKNDLVHKIWQHDADTLVALYVAQENSPLLSDEFFMNSQLGAIVIRQTADYVFALDTLGAVRSALDALGPAVPAKLLRKLFAQAGAGRTTRVSVRNSNLAPDAIRTRIFSAQAIRNTPPFFDDRNSVCTTVEGYVPPTANAELVRRYLGFARGRVSDRVGGYVPLPEYLRWLETLAAGLQSKAVPRPELRRYAQEIDPPPDPTPTHALIDFGEALDFYVCTSHPTAKDKAGLAPEDCCAPVVPDASGKLMFPVTANGTVFNVEISYDAAGERYELFCPELDSYYRSTDPANHAGLVRFLQQSQSLRVLPRTAGYFYTLGQFYHPEAAFGPAYDDEQLGVLRTLHPIPELAGIGSEKGDKAIAFAGSTWPSTCLFGLIDSLGVNTQMEPHFNDPDLVVCDDMQTESADFLFGDTNKGRVVFIHAKAVSEAKLCSASGMTEVCGQAMKNMKFLSKFNEEDAPGKSEKWSVQPWKHGVNTLSRIRRGTGTGKAVWKQFRRLIRDPLSTTEVWIVAGQLLSKNAFEQQLRSSPPGQEAVQLAYLLLSIITSAVAVGARLRVFCSP